MSDRDPPAYLRAHRAKQRLEDTRIDLGTIAAGVCVMLIFFAMTVLFPPEPEVAGGAVGIGIVLGGYVTGRLCDPAATCPTCHGVGAGLVFSVIVGLVGISSALSSEYELALAELVEWTDPTVGAPTLFLGIAISTIAGGIGGRGRNG